MARVDELLATFTDEQWERAVAPGKNRGIYLLGHLIAVHDHLIVLLDMGEPMYPELRQSFLTEADNAAAEFPSMQTLRQYWAAQSAALQEKFGALSVAQWFERHTAVPAEEFAAEPHRNKLNIVLTRTTHLQYHLGQLILLS